MAHYDCKCCGESNGVSHDHCDNCKAGGCSIAALTAENQRLHLLAKANNNLARLRGAEATAFRDALSTILYLRPAGDLNTAKNARKLVEQMETVAAAALSTPSEVSEPNPDEVAGTYSAFEVSEPVADHIGGEGERIAVWDVREVEDCGHRGMKGYEVLLPNGTWYDVAAHNPEDAIATANLDWRAEQAKLATPPNTNGDAVRQALEKQMEDQDTDLPSSIQRQKGLTWLEGWFDIDAALATLAKHGGAEG